MLDLIVKAKVRSSLNLFDSIPLIRNIFHITYVQNTGTAFGLFKGSNSILAVLSTVCIGLLIFYFYFHCKHTFLLSLCIGFVLGGALSNLFDRVCFGYVVDYIDFRVWPVFNISDMCISIGFFILFFLSFKTKVEV